MQTHASRRTFVRQMAVGLPVIAGSVGLTQTLAGAGAAQHGMPMPVPQVDLVLRDLARIHNQLRRRPLTPDDLRALGSQVRTLAAYQLQASRDVTLTRAMRDDLDARARTMVLDHTPDLEAMRRELVAFGFDQPSVIDRSVTRAQREAALDRLQQGGLAPLYLQVSGIFDNPELFMQLQSAATNCSILREMIAQMEVVAIVMCSMALALPLLAPDCFAATSVLAALKLAAYLGGC